MKQRLFKRFLSIALSLTMLVSLCPLALAAGTPAAEAAGEASESYEPWKHGYRLVDVLNWSPETDNYAEELRAHVPLQERNAPLAATQANPALKSEAMVYNVAMGNYRSTDTAEAPWNGGQYYDDFSYNLFKFWQYTDFIGAGGRPTSGFDSRIATEQERYEYGVIGIPIAAFTNTAHKNGVKAIAEFFFPRDPQYAEEWLYKDENGEFPYAKKMVEIAKYYGFDGYFINEESPAIDPTLIPVYKEIMQYMRGEGLYIQWYDANPKSVDGVTTGVRGYRNMLDWRNYDWLKDDHLGQVADSMWLNYWWNYQMIDDSVSLAKSLGLDPFKTLFLGFECGMGKFSKGANGMYQSSLYPEIGQIQSDQTQEYADWILDEDGNPKMSIALWGGDFTHEQYGKADNLRYTNAFQWSSEERERMWYTSPKESAVDHSLDGVDRPDVEVSGDGLVWSGLSKYVAERSAISGSVFTTNFNTGHGLQYWLNGKVSRGLEWSNMNLQDYMPTWQWWVDTKGTALNLDWDYGSKQEKLLADGTMGEFGYEQIGAYNGGSSLAIYGDLEAGNAQYINLYKTDLNVTANSKLSLTYAKPSADDGSQLALGVIFKDAPTKKVLLPLKDSGKQGSWRTAEVSLGSYAGKKIAAIGVQVLSDKAVEGYQVNLGRLALTDGKSYAPAAPKDLAVSKIIDGTGEIELTWTMDSYDTVKLYNVYAEYKNGTEKFVSGVYSDNLYISKLEDRGNVTALKLRAVGADGSESTAASVSLTTPAVSNIRTVSKNGRLTVTWDERNVDFDSVCVSLEYFYSNRKAPAAVTVDPGVKTATLNTGRADGEKYVLKLTTTGTETEASYFGRLSNTYCAPYDGELRLHDTDGTFSLTTPKAEDWSKLHVTMDGVTTTYSRHGGDQLYGIEIPDNLKLVSVVVEDMYGNRSTPVTFRFKAELGSMSDVVPDVEIPDAVLRKAIFAKAGGNTYAALTSLSGKLDLSGQDILDLTGMNLLVNVSELDISNTQVADLSPLSTLTNLKKLTAKNTRLIALPANALPGNLETLDLSGNTKLSTVRAGAVAALSKLKTLTLTDCAALKTLNLNNAGNIRLSLSGCAAVETLDLSGAQLKTVDISGMPKLKTFTAKDSSLETLTAAASYPNMASFDISGSRFDLSKDTPERALVNALKGIETLETGGQRPAITYAALPKTLTVEAGSETRLKTYFENIYNNSTTVRGTPYTAIAGEDWIAEDYGAKDLCAVPNAVYVEVRNADGKFLNEPEQPEVLVDVATNRASGATVLGVTAENSGETGAMLFDGSYSSKWCTGADTGWVAFTTSAAVDVGRWVTVHAQANNEAKEFNTVDYELQVLNTAAVGMSEAEFLASASSKDAAVLGNDANWTTVAHVTNNTEAIVDQELETAAPSARVYRLKVNVAYGDTPWGAIRFQEVELYAASNVVHDFEGKVKLEAGTYQVSFKKGLDTTLRTMTVVVE
ncbi:MAG: hypothetical protein K2N78_12555 [Oscillospiraceae bacterium]|nr:hypothetical protein [Oscillospiraceae bacterium]